MTDESNEATIAYREIASFLKHVQWVAIGSVVLWLLYHLGPILTPFIIAAMLGWLGDPIVDWFETKGRTRNQAVTIVTVVMSLLMLLVLIILLPLLQRQVLILVDVLPQYATWATNIAVPWLEVKTHLQIAKWLDFNKFFQLLQNHGMAAGSVAATVMSYVTSSGFWIVAIVVNLVLIPILTFFYMRDWDLIVARIGSLVPREHSATVNLLARESSAVLGGFLKGQFLVMSILGMLYGIGLWVVGINLGILIGLIAGLFTFVPYMGPVTGITLGIVAALVQFGDAHHIYMVLVVFGIGQIVESYFLTPRLVGDRIGLSQVAVMFAVLAGGQLFGFLGMLLALPIAAVANVLLRFAHDRYFESELYRGDPHTQIVTESTPLATLILPSETDGF